ncbi:hypothetical protein BDZ94DRAFT_52453 [Collybia nuda]|uniref:F-box domain-containing protein n=1 Tax=Collybia nuda TaxID=64659 RepID=A0A9P5YBK8_9AGAR|nr:hypothetical protein BDZ94DRAFT_52453 [Collybia nuda]
MSQTLLSELPAELLSKIFSHSLSARENSLFGIPLICQPPLQLLLVSQQWRGIALGTPELWQLLIINHTICKPEAGWGIVEYFSRARSLPLALRAQLPPGGFLKGRFFIPSWENLVSVDISGDTELQAWPFYYRLSQGEAFPSSPPHYQVSLS